MKTKLSVLPKTSIRLSLKKIIIYGILGTSLVSVFIYLWLTYLGIIGNTNKALAAQFSCHFRGAIITIDNTQISGKNNLIDTLVLVAITNNALKSVSNVKGATSQIIKSKYV
jgi:hypothetical protein